MLRDGFCLQSLPAIKWIYMKFFNQPELGFIEMQHEMKPVEAEMLNEC